MKVTQDVKSNRNGQIWAAAGDEVTVIRQDENVSIVELNGNRFSCRTEILTSAALPDITPDVVVQPKDESVRKPNRKKPAADSGPPSQNTLF